MNRKILLITTVLLLGITAAHAHEGDLVKRTTEAYLVHHVDFMTFLPFKDRLK